MKYMIRSKLFRNYLAGMMVGSNGKFLRYTKREEALTWGTLEAAVAVQDFIRTDPAITGTEIVEISYTEVVVG